jgi:hypothetical protein
MEHAAPMAKPARIALQGNDIEDKVARTANSTKALSAS